MKAFCVLFLISGCWAQVPMTPGVDPPPGAPALPANMPAMPANMPAMPANMPAMPTNMPAMPTNMPAMPVTLPTMPAGGTDPSAGGEGGTPNPTDPSNLVNPTGPPPNVNRPCRRYDLQCVRYFFKDHAHCKKPLGKVPEPYLHPLSNQFYPAFNLTVTNVNAYYTGFNTGRISDLYVNRQTDKVVIVIEFTNITKVSRDVFFRYHRRAREPIITYGYSTITYPSITLTVTIPQVDDLRLDMSDSFAYANAIPILDMDPRLGESSNPVVPTTFAAMMADLPTFATENLLTQSSFYTTVYIQKVICDFGLEIAMS